MTQLTSTNRRLCGMQLGYPGAGKTGSWACLANAGYQLRIIDLDHNLDPLLEFIDEEKGLEVFMKGRGASIRSLVVHELNSIWAQK